MGRQNPSRTLLALPALEMDGGTLARELPCSSQKRSEIACRGGWPPRTDTAQRAGDGPSVEYRYSGRQAPSAPSTAGQPLVPGQRYISARPMVYRWDLGGMPSVPSGPCHSQVPDGSTHPYDRYLLLYCDPVHRAIESPKVKENGGGGGLAGTLLPVCFPAPTVPYLAHYSRPPPSLPIDPTPTTYPSPLPSRPHRLTVAATTTRQPHPQHHIDFPPVASHHPAPSHVLDRNRSVF